MAMLDLDEAQARLLAMVTPGPGEQVPAGKALGRCVAEDIAALRTQPPADMSAMDGYAICGDGPWDKIGESRAGAPYEGAIGAGQCTRISTGAHMPKGADRVLIQENASLQGGKVTLAEGEDLPAPRRHVRAAGFDFALGDTVLRAGTCINAQHIALALSAGHGSLCVHAPPTIAILDSGDELASDPAACRPDQIPASNGAMIEAMLHPSGCKPLRLGPVADDLDALARALKRAEGVQIVITTGGASVGDHDLVQEALKAWGADIDFWKVAIKPGKPLMVAQRGTGSGLQVILGLPGNPVSSFVTATLFALPLVRAMMGNPGPLPKTQTRIAGTALPATGPRREFLRGISDGETVQLAASQDSSALLALASSNCLIVRPPHGAAIGPGGPVPVYNLHNG